MQKQGGAIRPAYCRVPGIPFLMTDWAVPGPPPSVYNRLPSLFQSLVSQGSFPLYRFGFPCFSLHAVTARVFYGANVGCRACSLRFEVDFLQILPCRGKSNWQEKTSGMASPAASPCTEKPEAAPVAGCRTEGRKKY